MLFDICKSLLFELCGRDNVHFFPFHFMAIFWCFWSHPYGAVQWLHKSVCRSQRLSWRNYDISTHLPSDTPPKEQFQFPIFKRSVCHDSSPDFEWLRSPPKNESKCVSICFELSFINSIYRWLLHRKQALDSVCGKQMWKLHGRGRCGGSCRGTAPHPLHFACFVLAFIHSNDLAKHTDTHTQADQS